MSKVHKTEPNGWPDPARPGVPLNPEQRARHWLRAGIRIGPTIFCWVPTTQRWRPAEEGWEDEYYSPAEMSAWTYEGPLLTPAEVAAREASAAEAAWLAGYFNACGSFIGEGEGDARIAARQSWEIHRDRFAAPDAPARARKEAWREGMEIAAGIVEAFPHRVVAQTVLPPSADDIAAAIRARMEKE